MTAYHEEDANFTGTDTDTDPLDLDPNGAQTRLLNDIFPDDLFTAGTRVNLFYRAQFVDTLGVPINTSWGFSPNDTSGGNVYEWECLPSSMDADTTFNCVLYVDHFDGRGAQPFIETALANVLTGSSSNFEGTPWDRWDVEAQSSQQASFGRPLYTEYGATVVQALGYETILWNSGNLQTFCVSKEDADVLIPWMTLPGFGAKNLYLSGDGIALSMSREADSEPSAYRLLTDLAGVEFTCRTFRDQDCPVGSPVDWTDCVELDPVTGAVVSGRPMGGTHVGQGSGCPHHRSFDVIAPNPSAEFGSPLAEEQYVGTKTVGFASVSNIEFGSGSGRPQTKPIQFQTIVDGLSVHYRRDPGDCEYLPTIPPDALEERLREVLDWFGSSGDLAACQVPVTTGIDSPVGHGQYRTTLANASPNPLRGGQGRLRFSLTRPGKATVSIFDLNGRLVKTIFDGEGQEGWNEATWDGIDTAGRPVASGVYFYRLHTDGKELSKKLIVIRD
jgi:hypothetical protein